MLKRVVAVVVDEAIDVEFVVFIVVVVILEG